MLLLAKGQGHNLKIYFVKLKSHKAFALAGDIREPLLTYSSFRGNKEHSGLRSLPSKTRTGGFV